MVKNYFGKLTVPENNMSEITYVLVNEKLNCSFNLTSYLKKNQGKEIGLVVNIVGIDAFCEVGKIQVISEVLMINGVDVSRVLWDSTGLNLKIIVDDLEEDL